MRYRQFPLVKKLIILWKYIVIILLTFILTLTISSSNTAQISLSNSGSDGESQFTPLCKLATTRVCGKLWCSDISFPYFPYEHITNKLDLGTSFTIALRANLEAPQSTAKELEIRANLIEETWLSLYTKIVKNSRKESAQNELNKLPKINLKPQDWLLFQEKPLHPLTSRVK